MNKLTMYPFLAPQMLFETQKNGYFTSAWLVNMAHQFFPPTGKVGRQTNTQNKTYWMLERLQTLGVIRKIKSGEYTYV